ncbi:MAG: MerR family DNA-binding protein, partial [Brevundimonas sp.]|uniref:MerR family DNA-binding protein n=1 Tax=Brevundimonas sp. TaxID=1871086 RepID=UPI002AB86DD7
GVETCREVRDMAQDHITSVDAKIADLQRLRRVLTQAVADCRDGDAVCCPVIEELGS